MHTLRISLHTLVLSVLYVTYFSLCPPRAISQTDPEPNLVGKPLFLRGFWLADQLNFDSTGRLIGTSAVGPITLSGIEVKRVHQAGKSLQIEGSRVALVASPDGKPGLHRVPITQTTHIPFSLRPAGKRDFHAEEQVRVTVQADATGGFDQALARIFSEDLTDLGASVPTWWQCYARSYFRPEIAADAEQQVERCVITPEVALPDGTTAIVDETGQPRAMYTVSPVLPQVSAELGVSGMEMIHARVRPDGVPVGLQVVRAIGGGADETILQAVSQWRFAPAQRDGIAVPANVTIRVQIKPPGR